MKRVFIVFLFLGSSFCFGVLLKPLFDKSHTFSPFIKNPKYIDSLKVDLGRRLFFDTRLSLNNTVSCSSCHNPEKAFCDNLPVSIGVNGLKSGRNTPSLYNVRDLKTVMFDAHLKTLELQVIVPIQEPSEMAHNMKNLIPILREDPLYQNRAQICFNRDFDAFVLTRSIAAFERTFISMNSKYDQFVLGNNTALSKSEKRGMHLFLNKLHCNSCHPPPYFTNFIAENNGFYKSKDVDLGRFRVTKDSMDIGKFKVPSLRNISLTFPYMHNGTLENLNSVIDHYTSGGFESSSKSPLIKPFLLTKREKQDLINFLGTLTDTSFIRTAHE